MSDNRTSKRPAELRDEQLDDLQGGSLMSSPDGKTGEKDADAQGVGARFMIGGSNGELG